MSRRWRQLKARLNGLDRRGLRERLGGHEVFDPETDQIIAAAIEVHRSLGPGLLESIYEAALVTEFELRGIPFERQRPVDVIYKDQIIKGQRIDLIVFGTVIVEIKSQRPNPELFRAQTLSYLQCSGLSRALILNFGLPTMKAGIDRVVR
ncbi:MAG: GxxExxY protein [Planctomycetes bacterium]|nr:GxxExxY protein [Planctomycetota bacterium]